MPGQFYPLFAIFNYVSIPNGNFLIIEPAILLSSGTYALMRDIYFPKISFKRIRTKYKKNLKRLVVTITDKGKGVDDNTLKIVLNGKPIDCEYDPDWQHVVIEDLRHILTGKNLLKVEIKDYGGNRSSRTFSFYLR